MIIRGIIDATSIIQDGDLLEVDGTSGIVKKSQKNDD